MSVELWDGSGREIGDISRSRHAVFPLAQAGALPSLLPLLPTISEMSSWLPMLCGMPVIDTQMTTFPSSLKIGRLVTNR